ncbi:MAG: polyribonucleotide nucleotidyltransferase, partial [Patescibacteria group bacterium]
LIKKVQAEAGKEKMVFDFHLDDEIKIKSVAYLEEKAPEVMYNSPKILKADRLAVKAKLSEMLNDYLISLGIEVEADRKKYLELVDKIVKKTTSKFILEKNQRLDGRAMDEIRKLVAEVDLLPHNHGSSLFMRGETQVLSTVTLGAPGDFQMVETMEDEGKKTYFHHYNFPPYATGETGRVGSTGRREIGHGALAEKALVPVLPAKIDFPYTIRNVSEVLGSNGSSSMASACASTLSLMAAGVPLKKPVAGIAIGLASEEDSAGNFTKYKVFTDLQDVEDGDGGMDFKVTGTRDGITALQMDTKTHGLTAEIMIEAFAQAKAGRLKIIDLIESVIPTHRAKLAESAPCIFTMKINPDKIRDVIGSGGKIINEIIAQTGASIDIEDDGSIFITAENAESADRAKVWIDSLTKEVEVGEVYDGKVIKIMDFGAFIEVLPKQEGLLHVSEISNTRVANVSDVLKEGEMIKVKVIKKDPGGKFSLSAKALLPRPEFKKE